jgi:hypothetical protein
MQMFEKKKPGGALCTVLSVPRYLEPSWQRSTVLSCQGAVSVKYFSELKKELLLVIFFRVKVNPELMEFFSGLHIARLSHDVRNLPGALELLQTGLQLISNQNLAFQWPSAPILNPPFFASPNLHMPIPSKTLPCRGHSNNT